MKKYIISLTLLLAIFSGPSVYALEVWSLERCIQHALENNLSIRSQRYEQEMAGHDLTQSYANMLPNLSASTRGGVNYGRSIDAVTNEFFTERIISQSLGASANVMLFAGFRTINNIRYHLARQTAYRYDTQKMENDLILTIANAYLQILYFEDMLEVTAQQLEVSRQQAERTRIMLEGGTMSRRDLLQMEAVAAEQEVIHTSIENNLRLSYLELIHLLELDPELDFIVDRPQLTVEDAALFYDAEAVLQKAMHIEPSLTASRERIAMAETAVAITRGERMPTLSLNAGLGSAYSEAFKRLADPADSKAALHNTAQLAVITKNTNGPVFETVPYADQLSDNYFRTASVSLHIPIFNSLQTRTRMQRARIDLEQARLQHENQKNNLSRVIHQAHADAVAAYKEYLSNSKALEASRESYIFAEENLAMGRVSTLEYNEALARYNRAKVNALQSQYEYVFKVKILEFYQGEGFVL